MIVVTTVMKQYRGLQSNKYTKGGIHKAHNKGMQIFASVDMQRTSFYILAEAHHQQVLECAYIIRYCQLLPIHYIDNEYQQERIAAGL